MKYCLQYLRALLIIGFVFGATSFAIAQQYYRVTVDGLNIRTGPGKNYNTVAVALKGDTLEGVHDLKGWVEVIAVKDSKRGFVASQMIEKIDMPKSTGGGFWSFFGKLFKWVLIIAALYLLYKWAWPRINKLSAPVKKPLKPVVKEPENNVQKIIVDNKEPENNVQEIIVDDKEPEPQSEKIVEEPVVGANEEPEPQSQTEKIVEEPVVDVNEEPQTLEVSDAFEQFIVNKLNQNPSFSIKRWRSDKFVDRIFIQSNKHPDFEIVFSITKDGEEIGHSFGLECKWRHYFFNDKIELEASQINHYKQFVKEENKPVYIVIGVGGKASEPETLFLVPLEDVEGNTLDREFLVPYNCSVDDTFYYDVETGKLELR